MKNFDTRVYSIADFVEWDENGLLDLSPDFQRRGVWIEKAKSYLIDTILRGRPIPKIIISQDLKGTRQVRIVVDGQQRIRAILDFYNGNLRLSRIHHPEFGGNTFDELPQEVKTEFLKYELGVDLLFSRSYEDILDIFARLNSYTVNLNKPELWNARYLGYFKKYAFDSGTSFVRYFLEGKILTRRNIARMSEVELASDLLVALIDGVQTNKSIESFYRKYEDDIGKLERTKDRFDKVMSYELISKVVYRKGQCS